MGAGGAELGRRLGGLVHIAAIPALPCDNFVLLENFSVFDVLAERQVARLVVGLNFGYLAEHRGYLGKAFLVGNFGGLLVDYVPLFVLACCRVL